MKPLLNPHVLQKICKATLAEFGKSSRGVKPEKTSDATIINYSFDPGLVEALRNNLNNEYPFLYDGPIRWVANTAAGATGWLALLYASLKEYLILFGCSNKTDGHSGRYRSAVYDTVLVGEMNCSAESDPTVRHIFHPGTMGVLPRRTIKSYSINEGTWMLEYARGNVPSMLPTGLADNLYSNLDYKSFRWTVHDYAKMVFYNQSGRRAYLKNMKTP